jgi:hypothetical protein
VVGFLLPRGCVSRRVLSVANTHYGRLKYSCVMVGDVS